MGILRIPGATYRLQFNREFRFADARALVPYLHALGVTDLYASPLLKARPGSQHGYDVTDPTQLNPELGSTEEFAGLTGVLQQNGMGLLLDIVPNHMAASSENLWWLDVLRNGPDSPYSSYFDINWRQGRPGLKNRTLLPILAHPYGRTLENQELTLTLTGDGLWLVYHGQRFPLNPRSYTKVLAYRAEELARALGPEHPVGLEFADLVTTLENWSPDTEEGNQAILWQRINEKLWRLYTSSPEAREFIRENLRILNGEKGNPQSFDQLDKLLADQAYRPAFWQVVNQESNYRRFFAVSDLVSMRVEKEDVFDATHARILQLAWAGQVSGLRIDHIDGLHDPGAYLHRLHERLPGSGKHPGFYMLVEKILCGDEQLADEWPVYGTTGYDFLNTVNGLFVYGPGLAALAALYDRLGGSGASYEDVARVRKRSVMAELFGSEVRALTQQLGSLAEQDRNGHDLTLTQLEAALIEVTACLPVYRTYTHCFKVAPRDQTYIEHAIAAAVQRHPAITPAGDFLRRVLLLKFPENLPTAQRQAWLEIVMRWQQFTGPIMAKGVEDSALYVYNRLVSLNEVGGDPQTTGVPVAKFHQYNRARLERWPHTLNATSTHDTKRSEDVRARINVLSEIPDIWADCLERWLGWNQPYKPVINGQPVPEINMELLIYQTLVGAWPLTDKEQPEFKKRLGAYLIKAAREAGINTNWLQADTGYERVLGDFVASILEPIPGNRFPQDLRQLQHVVAYYGAVGSLAQVALKLTSPGVPDIYQGTELWDFSLVDPDNRRPVDFSQRAAVLSAIKNQETGSLPDLARNLVNSWEDGRIKLFLTYKILQYRRTHPRLFASGEYLPVEASGPYSDYVCAYMRHWEGTWALVAAPRLLARLHVASQWPNPNNTPSPGQPAARPLQTEMLWGQTSLILDQRFPNRWYNILTARAVTAATGPGTPTTAPAESNSLSLAEVFQDFPVALMVAGKKNSRQFTPDCIPL